MGHSFTSGPDPPENRMRPALTRESSQFRLRRNILLTRQQSGKIADVSARMSPQQLHTWETLQLVMDALRREVGRDLWNDAKLSDAEFTVLAHLHSSGEEGVRPAQCARAIGWDSSRLAHQLRRLEKRGLVATRPAGGEDGRATLSSLTPAGHDQYRRAIGPHLDSARRWFADGLT